MYSNFQFCILNVHNILKIVHVFVYLMYIIFQFCSFDVHNFVKNVHYFVYSKYTNFQKIYIVGTRFSAQVQNVWNLGSINPMQ